jgi:hypothetical protein
MSEIRKPECTSYQKQEQKFRKNWKAMKSPILMKIDSNRLCLYGKKNLDHKETTGHKVALNCLQKERKRPFRIFV